MKKILSLLSAGALALAMISPAMAGGDVDTTPHPYAPRGALGLGHSGGDGALRVRDRHFRDRDRGGSHWRGDHRGFYHHRGNGWYNGHRGYRSYHRGYRYYNGWWFPGAAFLGGAIIGGALAPHPVYRGGGSYHVRWCYNRYRSYRASDNTYQPYQGPRRQCVSP
ncbi:MAG: BA14K family protein [Rhizobiaceae bacterium]|nr:MAG: BA14K family protein [Rhizobiaceae bacterium]